MRDMDSIKRHLEILSIGEHENAYMRYVIHDMRRLIARVERLEKGMDSLLRVTGLSTHFPIEYEILVLRTAQTALAEEDGE